jgi:hypothetical protein
VHYTGRLEVSHDDTMATSLLARLPLLLLALIALVIAVWVGLIRIGWVIPQPAPGGVGIHGPLLISGFLGTVIGLERAVAAGRRWAYSGPLLSAVGGLALILGLPVFAAQGLMTLSSLILVATLFSVFTQQRAAFIAVMVAGAAAWLAGNIVWWASGLIPRAVPWWAGFLVVTIAGERLELSRLVRITAAARITFLLALALAFGGIAVSVVAFDPGMRWFGAGMIALMVWLLIHDIARRTVRQPGLTRYIALCLLAGYAWLGISGLLFLLFGGQLAGTRYDAMLHALLVGCIFSLIFGHAPIIVPALFGLMVPYWRAFYAHLVVLHASLALRLAGDLLLAPDLRRWGGLLNAVALLLFFMTTAAAVKWSRRAS